MKKDPSRTASGCPFHSQTFLASTWDSEESWVGQLFNRSRLRPDAASALLWAAN